MFPDTVGQVEVTKNSRRMSLHGHHVGVGGTFKRRVKNNGPHLPPLGWSGNTIHPYLVRSAHFSNSASSRATAAASPTDPSLTVHLLPFFFSFSRVESNFSITPSFSTVEMEHVAYTTVPPTLAAFKPVIKSSSCVFARRLEELARQFDISGAVLPDDFALECA